MLDQWRLQTCGVQEAALRMWVQDTDIGLNNLHCRTDRQDGVRARAKLRSTAAGLAVYACLHLSGLAPQTGPVAASCGRWLERLPANSPAGSRFWVMDGAIPGVGDGNHFQRCRFALLWMAETSRAGLRRAEMARRVALFLPPRYLRRMEMVVLPERRTPGDDAALPRLSGDNNNLPRC
jgi:mannose/cellobiose epimerase-like protein (N-acyl-D-glucosamine 2-epimerase family)